MAVSHVKSVTVADFTGTVTAFNSQGSTTTVAASDLARPSDWNSAHNQLYTLTGNTTNGSTASGTNVILSGGPGIVLGGFTGSIQVGLQTVSGFNPYPDRLKVAGAMGNGTIQIDPENFPAPVVFDRAAYQINFSNATNSSGSGTLSAYVGFYTKNGSTLSLAHSASGSSAWTLSGTAGSYSLFSGMRLFTIPYSQTLNPGDYWIAAMTRHSTAGANHTLSNMVISAANSNYVGVFGASNNTTQQITLGQGVYTASSDALPGSIAFSQIRGSASIAFRPPAIYFPYSTV